MGFFCYSCGKEVQRNTKVCPSCGVYFKAVKCPSCGYTDEADFFKGGCPRCGYLGREETAGPDVKKRKSLFGIIPARVFWSLSVLLLAILVLFLFLIIR